MNLLPIASLLENNSLGVQGQTIFINQMPVDASQAILLREPIGGTKINYELEGYFKTTFQVIIRSEGYATGIEFATNVNQALTINETQVDTQYFRYSRPLTMPVAFPLSKGNLLEIATTFECVFME